MVTSNTVAPAVGASIIYAPENKKYDMSVPKPTRADILSWIIIIIIILLAIWFVRMLVGG